MGLPFILGMTWDSLLDIAYAAAHVSRLTHHASRFPTSYSPLPTSLIFVKQTDTELMTIVK